MTSSDDTKYSSGVSRGLGYESTREFEPLENLSRYFEEIEGHVERHIGPVELVYDEISRDNHPIDIMVVPANSDRRFHYLITSGMSNKPMHLSKNISNSENWRFAELVMALPSYWPVTDQISMQQQEWFYPIEHLKFLARIPQTYKSWLSIGHSIPNSEPAKQIGPECDMTGFVLDYPVLGGESFTKMTSRDKNVIRFYAVYPVYSSEMDLKIKKTYSSLRKRFAENKVIEIFDPQRTNSVPSGWRSLLSW